MITKEELEKLYIHEKKSTVQIGKILNKDKRSISYYLSKYKIPIRKNNRYLNLKGQRFGQLVAKTYIWGKRGQTYWECDCDCGKTVRVMRNSLTTGKRTDCGTHKKSPKDSHKWKGIDDIPGTFFNKLKRHAKRRGIKNTVSNQYIVDTLYAQNNKCALSGDEIWFDGLLTNGSIDRIDSSKGYEEGNIQWVTINVNFAKQRLSNKDFIELCQKIANYQKEKEFS